MSKSKSVGTDRFLPYGRQVIDESDIAAVAAVLKSDYLTTGPAVPAFERAFAESVDAPHAIAVSSGTAALHLICLALSVKPGVSVIVPSITFLATANAGRLCGADIVFADVDPETGLMTPDTLKDAIKRARSPVRIVFAVDLAGQTCDLAELAAICGDVGADLVEDACHALGTRYRVNGKQCAVGSCRHSTAAAFSLHPVKTIAAGEGGVVTTRDEELAARISLFRNHGLDREPENFTETDLAFDDTGQPNPWYYEMHEPGYNYRLSDIHAALAMSQLEKLSEFAKKREALAAAYDERIGKLSLPVHATVRVKDCSPVLHLYQVLIEFDSLGRSRLDVMCALREHGIGTQVHYIPVHCQPYYRGLDPELELPGAKLFYERTLSLPMFAAMNERDVERVVAGLRRVLDAG